MTKTALVVAGAIAWVSIADTWAAQSFEHVVAPKKVVEECMHLAAGAEVTYSFTASAPIEFNIHYHTGKSVVFPVKREGVSVVQDLFRAESAQEYCWMWTNRTNEPVSMRGTIR